MKNKYMNKFDNSKKWIDYLVVIVLYFAAYIFLPLNSGLFWDDWVWTGNSFSDYIIISQKLFALKFPGVIMAFIYMIPPSIVRTVVFICYLIPGIILYRFCEVEGFKRLDRLFIVLFFLLIPLNLSKYTLSTSLYAFCYALFYIATYIYIANISNKYLFLRAISLLFFIVSFSMNSLLVFFAIPYLYAFYKSSKNHQKNRPQTLGLNALHFVKSNFDYTALPFVFFGFKQFAMHTNPIYINGEYAKIAYNSIGLNNIVLSPIISLLWLLRSFADALVKMTFSFYSLYGIGISVLAVILYVMFVDCKSENVKNIAKLKALVYLGLIAFFLGTFPYIAVGAFDVGNAINYEPFSSRNTILLSLGLAFVFYGSFALLEIKLRHLESLFDLAKIIIIISFISFNLSHGKDFYFDNIKHQSLIMQMANNNDIRNESVFLVKDETLELNANNRKYVFYEFSGLFYKTFGDETRMATYLSPTSYYELKDIFNSRNNLPYKIKESKYYRPSHIIVITKNNSFTGWFTCIMSIYNSFFNNAAYLKTVNNFVKIHVEKI